MKKPLYITLFFTCISNLLIAQNRYEIKLDIGDALSNTIGLGYEFCPDNRTGWEFRVA